MKSWQVRLTDEEYDLFVAQAGEDSLATYFRKRMFSEDCLEGRCIPEPHYEPVVTAHGKIEPIRIPQNALESKNERLVELQKKILEMEKKPVKRGAVASGYRAKPRGVEYNPLGEYEEAVIDVNTW